MITRASLLSAGLFTLLLTVGCGGSGADGEGLTDDGQGSSQGSESTGDSSGNDRGQPNTGDGDGDEAGVGTPMGQAACSEGETGRSVGDLAEDFTLTDQNGNEISLSDYCGQVVFIPMGAMWCPACQSAAEKIPQMIADYGDQGLVILDLMAETSRGDTPDQAALGTWADTYDITTPVLADTDWSVWERYWPSHSTPKALLIGRDGTLLEIGWVGTRSIENALE